MARFDFRLDTVELQNKASDLRPKIETAINQTVMFGSQKGMAYMKETAPWTDRTGNARSGLFTVPNVEGNLKTITFAHTMSYGVWPEIKNNGEYAVIMPSVLHTGKQIMASFSRTLDRIR